MKEQDWLDEYARDTVNTLFLRPTNTLHSLDGLQMDAQTFKMVTEMRAREALIIIHVYF